MSKMEQLRAELDAQRGGRDKKKKKWLILLLLLLLALTLAGVLYLSGVFGPKADVLIGGNLTQGEIAGLSTDGLQEYLQNHADDAHVTLQMNTRPIFESGSGEGDLLIQNPAYNAFDMEVVIYLGSDSSGTEVYRSGIIPPGYYIGKDVLHTELGKGEHKAVAYLSFYEGDNHITTASADMTLVVQN